MNAVTANRLSKEFGPGIKAADSISFELKQGEVFGFLGPNGAGKTTTVKMLSGLLEPSSGSCEVFGINPSDEPVKIHEISGIVTEHAQMYDSLSGFQNLVFYGKLFGLDEKQCIVRAEELLAELDLSSAKDRMLSAYSTGMRQRLSLARALMHRPKILFLDEPTSGLDPQSTLDVNSMIKNLAREEGTAVFLCTHQLRYAQEICSSYGLIDRGTLFASGTIDELRSMVSGSLKVLVRSDILPAGLPFGAAENGYAEITAGSEEEIPDIVRKITEAGGRIYHVSAQKISLEDIYFSLLEKRKELKHDQFNAACSN